MIYVSFVLDIQISPHIAISLFPKAPKWCQNGNIQRLAIHLLPKNMDFISILLIIDCCVILMVFSE